jgi:hypothetical protein
VQGKEGQEEKGRQVKKWLHNLMGEFWTRLGRWLHERRHWNPK